MEDGCDKLKMLSLIRFHVFDTLTLIVVWQIQALTDRRYPPRLNNEPEWHRAGRPDLYYKPFEPITYLFVRFLLHNGAQTARWLEFLLWGFILWFSGVRYDVVFYGVNSVPEEHATSIFSTESSVFLWKLVSTCQMAQPHNPQDCVWSRVSDFSGWSQVSFSHNCE